MNINIKNLLHSPDLSIPFEYALDLSGIEHYGEKPFTSAKVKGSISSHSGMIRYLAAYTFDLHTSCARCAEDVVKNYDFDISHDLVPAYSQHTRDYDEVNDSLEDADMIRYDGDTVDIDEIAMSDILLGIEPLSYCGFGSDCKGICPACGENLNISKCACNGSEQA